MNSRNSWTKNRDDAGFALIIVLWALVVASGLVLTAAAAVRTDSYVTRNLLDEAEARHLAQSAVLQTVARLLDTELKPKIDLSGASVEQIDLLGHQIDVRVVDECAKVDLNTGWSGLIAGLVGGQQPGTAGISIAQAILDWRDPDNRRRPRGAEDADYAEIGLTHGAGDSLFAVVDELQLVKGVNSELYRRLLPHITVNCLNSGVDATVASATTLASIPGVEPSALAAYLDARRLASLEERENLANSLEKGSKYFDLSPQAAFEITATARPKAGVEVTWQAVIWLTGDDKRPYVVRRWERFLSNEVRG